MDSLKSHYRQLLGLDDSWIVTSVNLDLVGKRVVIRLEHVGNKLVCAECSKGCSMKDHAPERRWRHLDTMQFETILEARVPRSPQCPPIMIHPSQPFDPSDLAKSRTAVLKLLCLV